ncbi:MAG TPA: pyridoxamine 5'-phosphate oxidase family protein [Segeticoccus sp.]|uniref:pyridoxamine 5'-phosphate oxidase family protein n=1 Tax=Segeticoccus sp. TaxID=2706531 RepID=UPI002D800A9E|nr:pyridoxamine 5'-phosphate oxidase family protein [Segeticoccus sp.]HET8599088.1 pyridoxamine 5'-phosphate oxidase family protein [Segeticoccus sp.]
MTTIDETSWNETGAVDHRGLRVLGFEECLRRVTAAPMGRLAFHDAGEVLVLPVNHVTDGLTVAFRTTWGSKLAAAVGRKPVAFEVDGYDAATRAGWSVLVKGTADIADDEQVCARLEELLGIPWTGPAEDSFWVRVRADEVTGRELLPAVAAS